MKNRHKAELVGIFSFQTQMFIPETLVQFSTQQIIKAVISSATEAKLEAFLNAKQAMPMCQTFLELEHPQPMMLIQTDNSMVFGMVTHKIIPKARKAMDMHFH